MSYLQFLAILLIIPLLYTIPNTILSLLIGLINLPKNQKFYFLVLGRIIRCLLYSSMLISFADYFASLGLKTTMLYIISYSGLIYALTIETKIALINKDKNIEYSFALDLKSVIGLIYSLIYVLVIIFPILREPWLSSITLNLIVKIQNYKLFIIIINLLGIGAGMFIVMSIIGFIGYTKNKNYKWSMYFSIASNLPIRLVVETIDKLKNRDISLDKRIGNILFIIPLILISPIVLFIGFLIMRRQESDIVDK